MLSGSWRRSPASSPSLPAAMPLVASRGSSSVCGVPSGTVVLEAQYDYKYHGADGRQVCIREGERYVLLKKTNSDWWQVRRIGAASKAKPLYVPAAYVVEVPVAPLGPPKRSASSSSLLLSSASSSSLLLSSAPSRHGATRISLTPSALNQYPGAKTFCRSMENLTSHSASWGAGPESAGGGHYPTLPRPGSSSSITSSSGHLMVPSDCGRPARSIPSMPRSKSSISLPQHSLEEQGGPRALGPSPLRAPSKSRSQWDMADRVSHLQVPGQAYASHPSLQESHLDGDLGQVRRGSQGQPAPPSPSPGQAALQTLDLWEQYLDPTSGRYFYVNSSTKERSWKPPRRARQHSWTSTLPTQSQSFTRNTSHLSLPLTDSANRTMQRLSPDFLSRGPWNAEGGRQVKQSIQRAASSDTLHTAALHQGASHRTHSALRSDMFSHSMILPETQSKGREVCYSVTNIVVEPPSPDNSSPDDSTDGATPELEKAGPLNKTKIAEGGRKLRKNWHPSWVVLVGNSLVFFKDLKSHGQSNWKPGNSRPESSVDLRGGTLQWANELSSKKNVFKLRTVTGNEFLLQSDTISVIREWYNTIQSVIERLERENPLDNVLLYSLRRAGSVELLDHSGDEEDGRDGNKPPRQSLHHSSSQLLHHPTSLHPLIYMSQQQSPEPNGSDDDTSGDAPVGKSQIPRSSSNLENTERKRVKTRLKQLILKRPPLQSLQAKGLIKDQVFGCGLEMLCEREKSTVPRFVRLCTEAVERRGLETDGIYRVSGNLAVIQKLRFLVNHEGKLNLDSSEWEDIHVITGALKLFFRELPEPLVPYDCFTDLVEAVKMTDLEGRRERLKGLVLTMPPHNHNTMHFMLKHLRRVMEHVDVNRMSTQNIGIVFGPTLMRPECDNANMAINMVYQNQAVELMLREFDHIFTPHTASPDKHLRS